MVTLTPQEIAQLVEAGEPLAMKDAYAALDSYRPEMGASIEEIDGAVCCRLNITVQTLTSVSIMLMSITAVTGWYGMNFEEMPELSQWWGYPSVMVVVAVILVLKFSFFRRKRWL